MLTSSFHYQWIFVMIGKFTVYPCFILCEFTIFAFAFLTIGQLRFNVKVCHKYYPPWKSLILQKAIVSSTSMWLN